MSRGNYNLCKSSRKERKNYNAKTVRKNFTIFEKKVESAYENALAFDLKQMGFDVEQQYSMPFIYKSEFGIRTQVRKLLKNSIHRIVNNL